MRNKFTVLVPATLAWVTLNLAAQPVITAHPLDQTNAPGTTAVFTVEATGTPPVSFQWRHYANATTFTNIVDATNTQLLVPNAQATVGRFGSVVSDSTGAVTSRQARLVVLALPSVVQQPARQSVEPGVNVTFTVAGAGGAPLSYQWLWNSTPLAGRTNTTLALTNVQPGQAGDYTAVVRNPVGVATSQVATLVVHVPTTLTTVTQRWRYDQSGADLGSAWKEAAFDDGAWPESAGAFYNETAALPVPRSTLLALTNAGGTAIQTYYFRTHFNFTGETNGLFLVATGFVDDGAIFYLNGSELGRLRMPGGSVTAATAATEAPEARAVGMNFPASALLPGDNVLAVEVHQHSLTQADVVFGLSLKATSLAAPLPDLLVWGPAMFPRFEERVFATNSCEVMEVTVLPGLRRLLRFTTETRNAGTADLVQGLPVGNPEFEFHPCHNHYHFLGYVDYRLLKWVNSNWVQVTRGHKPSFGLLDSDRWDTNAAATARFDDTAQGIQKGWSDIYTYNVPGQYVDVTDVPPGLYRLEIEVDPDHRIPELNDSNNITAVKVEVPATLIPCAGTPPGDHFAGALLLPPYAVVSGSANSECATREAGEPKLVTGTRPGGPSVWFRWTAPFTGPVTIDTEGSNFDTVLGLYTGTSVNNLTLVASDDESGMALTSRLVANVIVGTVYSIQVEGFHLFSSGIPGTGDVLLNINANANDPFVAAQLLTSSAGTISGTTRTATKQPGEPSHAGNLGGRSIWYSWTAPLSGEVTFDTVGSRFDTLLAVYTGSPIDALTPVASNDDASADGGSRVLFNAVAGTIYRVAVDGRDGAAGLCVLRWRPALRLHAPSSAGGNFQFILSGLPGERSWIESSSNLIHWTPWQEVTNTSGTLPVTAPATMPHQFFRVRVE